MISAELAMAIPSLLVVLALCLAGLGLAIDQIRCVDAARVAARAASRGEPDVRARDLAEQVAPEGARIVVARQGAEVVVEVVARPRGLLWQAPQAKGRAVAVLEPGVPVDGT